MASIGSPQYISVAEATRYAAQAGFSNVLVPKSQYAPGNYSQLQTIIGIAGAESNYNIHAYNPSDPYGGSYGILQINGSHFHTGGTSQAAALNPQSAFQYAYTLSNHGTNFLPWGTFTNQSYLRYISNVNATAVKLPSTGWWTYPHDYDYGKYPDPQGPYNKPDVNVRVPYGYPIATPFSGIVSGINAPDGSIPSYGATVTIKLDSPVNNLATHIAFLHLADVTVRNGQRVNVGDIVAHAGDSNHAAGSAPALLGVAMYAGPYYGYGKEWSYNQQGNPQLDPSPVIDSIAGNNNVYSSVSPGGTPEALTSSAFMTLLSNSAQTAVKAISPDANVATVLETIDIITSFQSPVNIIASSNAPSQWIPDLALWGASNITALVIRSAFLFGGIYLCFQVFNQLTHTTENISKAVRTGVQVAGLAAL